MPLPHAHSAARARRQERGTSQCNVVQTLTRCALLHARLQGPIANLNAHLADPFVSNGFSYAGKFVPQ
jgi:hypothetical protein